MPRIPLDKTQSNALMRSVATNCRCPTKYLEFFLDEEEFQEQCFVLKTLKLSKNLFLTLPTENMEPQTKYLFACNEAWILRDILKVMQ